MVSRGGVAGFALCWFLSAAAAEAQWADPKLIAGQVGFNVAISFFGKVLLRHESPGRAIKEALAEGSVAGLTAHAGYTLAGQHPNWALAGKALAQKSVLTTRRSLQGQPVFDHTLYENWELTHSFVHFKWDGSPRIQLDAVNAAFSSYYLFSGDPYELDGKRSLLSGSLVFRHRDPPNNLRGYYVPGVIWIDDTREELDAILGHEIVHSLQAERGSTFSEWEVGSVRINWLIFGSGVPALLAGWPEHDDRLHEKEADKYAGTE